MFTGIIEETGIVKSFVKDSSGATITVEGNVVLQDSKLGDSIAINGVCQTVINLSSHCFSARVSEETLGVTNFSKLKRGDVVNLERALTLNSRLGGHIVLGHVDCTARYLGKEQLKDFYNLSFELEDGHEKYVVHKGSIAVNGISLTIAQICGNVFKVAIIPHTYQSTSLCYLNPGDYVNIETDILGKYVEKFLSVQDNNSSISMDFLKENGFL